MAESKARLERQKQVVFPFHFDPDKKLIHVVARLSDEPGALAALLRLLGTRLNLMGVTSYSIDGGSAIFSGFAEALFDSDGAGSIREVVAQSPQVSDCKVWESSGGLLIDQFHTGLQTGSGEPYIMMPTEGLARTFEEVVHTFGSGGETILFLQGKGFALSRVESYKSMLGPNPIERAEEAAHIYEALGYGSSRISVEAGGSRIRVVRQDCFECSGQSKRGRSCAFNRGLVAGSFQAVLGKEMECEETRCRLKGDSECEFLLTERLS